MAVGQPVANHLARFFSNILFEIDFPAHSLSALSLFFLSVCPSFTPH
jgi:hypothetical protein